MSGKNSKNTIHIFRELEFMALTPLDKNRVQIQFRGAFNKENVVWNATISSLRTRKRKENISPDKHKQSISISLDKGNHYKIHIELDVDIITEATIFKTMLMIHNYKRLDIGRHEFGPAPATTA